MALLVRLSPILVTAALLAACAPAATGTAPSSAYPITSRAIGTSPGGTVYVQAHYTFGDFSIDPTTITGMMWVPSGYDADSAVMTTEFSLKDVRVPEGWSLSLVQVQATRTTVAPARTIDKSTTVYTLTALLEVRAKPGAVAGPYHLRAALSYQKQSTPIRIDLTVAR